MEKRDIVQFASFTVLIAFFSGLIYAIRDLVYHELLREFLTFVFSGACFFAIAYGVAKYERWWPPSVGYLRRKNERRITDTLDDFRTKTFLEKTRENVVGFSILVGWVLLLFALTLAFRWLFYATFSSR